MSDTECKEIAFIGTEKIPDVEFKNGNMSNADFSESISHKTKTSTDSSSDISSQCVNKELPVNETCDKDVTNFESSDTNTYQMGIKSGHRIITEIVRQNKTTCWPFLEAVDAEGLGLWDYHLKIKEPMWLNKIIDNFENNRYTRFAEFARDFRIMVENCYRYNTTEHPISKKAKKLEMTFEAKLALLKKDIRDSATIAKTSNGRFATVSTESNSTMRSGRVSVPLTSVSRDAEADRQGRLVYDFVRCEEATLAEDERLSSYREHKQQQTLYQQVAAAFVVSLESREEAKEIKTCHLLPEIGLFLHLTEGTLRLPPLAMYSLEMSLLIPSDSIYLAKIMTSFLCTYYERSLITQRPAMLFKTWENRLKQRLEKWFELVLKYNSYHCAAYKLHIGLDFYKAMNWKNPFYTEDGKNKSFLDLSYNEKAMIIKALCDNLTTFQSVQNNIASLSCEQSRAMTLGCDADGNEYNYFPQFCGDDVRIYRHRRYGDLPDYEAPDPAAVLLPQKELINSLSNHTNAETNSRMDTTELIEGQPSSAGKISVESNVATPPDAEESAISESRDILRKPALPSGPDTDLDTEPDKKEANQVNKNDVKDERSTSEVDGESSVTAETDFDTSADMNAISADDTSTTTETDDQTTTFGQNCSLLHTKIKKITASQSKLTKLFAKTNDSDNCYDSSDAQWTPKKKSKKKSEEMAGSPLRRSSRKRATVNYTSLLIPNDPDNAVSELGIQESKSPAKKRRKRTPRLKPTKKTSKIVVKVIEPDEAYGSADFELVCDNIETLRNLIAAQETDYENAVKNKKSETTIGNVSALLEKLKWLLGELSSFETHFEKARFDAKIQLKREHDELLRAATTGRAIQTNGPDVDPWEDELISKNTVVQSDGTSVYTPPASIYYEESDEESDRELRRSKRRPKRYESDEDFVLDSSDESPQNIPTFSYDEFDEDRQRLVPAALEELEARLQKQAAALQKMMGCGRNTRQNEFGDGSQLLINERRTRQRSKKENKVFKKVLLLAFKERDEVGPSLLPLLRTDQTEIGEIVERILTQEEIARQQRKEQREEEQKRKRALKQAMLQKNKAVQASRRTAKKLVNKYKTERHEIKDEGKSDNIASTSKSPCSMWSPPKKQAINNLSSGIDNRTKIVTSGKAENVVVRLQNGKIGRALRFSDGRVVPIMRMDDAKAITGVGSPSTSREQRNVQTFHPHISLSAHRATILRRVDSQRRTVNSIPATAAVVTNASTLISSTVSCSVTTNAVKTVPQVLVSSVSKSTLVAPTVSVGSSSGPQQQSSKSFPALKPSIPSTAVSQRIALPSGQVINLMVKPQPTFASVESNAQGNSVRRLISGHTANSIDSTKPIQSTSLNTVATLIAPRAPAKVMTAPSTKLVLSPSIKPESVTASQATNQLSNLAAAVAPPKLISKPLGIVSPMPVKQPNAMETNVQRPPAEKNNSNPTNVAYLTVSQHQQQPATFSPMLSAAPRYHEVRGMVNHQEQQSSMAVSSSQRLQVGMQNVTLVTQPIYQQTPHQQVQLVPTLVAGSVPLVQPVQFVQTVPIQVNAPVMFVTQGQSHMQVGVGGNDPPHRQFPVSSPSKVYPPSTSTTQSM